MSTRSGRKTSRNKMTTYKGFDIIQVTIIEYYKPSYSQYYTNIPNKKPEVHYDFCKEGESNRPSQAYEVWAKDVAKCKECIDNFIEDDTLYFTSEEREKYVYKPNHKCQWAYNYDSLMKIMREHQKADRRVKRLLEDRLEDANFHSWCGLLGEEKYDEYEKLAASELKLNEKFEVYTHTMRKRIKDPKRFEEGLKKVIEDYLVSQGVKDTSAEVKFCEEW